MTTLLVVFLGHIEFLWRSKFHHLKSSILSRNVHINAYLVWIFINHEPDDLLNAMYIKIWNEYKLINIIASSGYIFCWITSWGEKLHDKSTTNANLVIKGKLMKLLLCDSQGFKISLKAKNCLCNEIWRAMEIRFQSMKSKISSLEVNKYSIYLN